MNLARQVLKEGLGYCKMIVCEAAGPLGATPWVRRTALLPFTIGHEGVKYVAFEPLAFM